MDRTILIEYADMKEEIKLINGSELQRQLEPLYELKSDIVNLKTEISKKTSAKFYTIPQVCEILHVSRSMLIINI